MAHQDGPPMDPNTSEATRKQIALARAQGDAYGRALKHMTDEVAADGGGQRAGDHLVGNAVEKAEGMDERVDGGLDDTAMAATVGDEGEKGGRADGVESDAAGHIYATTYEHHAVFLRLPGGEWETVVHDPRLLWPETLSLANDGYLYVTANQLHRQAQHHEGRDLRRQPYGRLRVRVDARPVQLRHG